MLINGRTIQHLLIKYARAGGSPRPGTIVLLDEISEIQLHTWAILAQWKLMGVRFILMGDLDGQSKPIFDSWNDSMKKRDIRKSHFLHEMANGLHVHLSTDRRGEKGDKLFPSFVALYPAADLDPDVHPKGSRGYMEVQQEIEEITEMVAQRFPAHDGPYEKRFVRSHRERVEINALVNPCLAAEKEQKLFLPSAGSKRGDTMEAQDMWIWPGMELVAYSQEYSENYPVNGAVYVVEGWDAQFVCALARGVPDLDPRGVQPRPRRGP